MRPSQATTMAVEKGKRKEPLHQKRRRPTVVNDYHSQTRNPKFEIRFGNRRIDTGELMQ